MIGNSNQSLRMENYLADIIELIKKDEYVNLEFWLRNVEVYIRDQSYVLNKNALEIMLEQTIPHVVGGQATAK